VVTARRISQMKYGKIQNFGADLAQARIVTTEV
jgi:hypothetical protein